MSTKSIDYFFVLLHNYIDCSALGLGISEHTLWLLTSHGRIQCRENISLANPIGTRSTTLPGRFNSIAGLFNKRNYFDLFLYFSF
jgi:hypothetical protein